MHFRGIHGHFLAHYRPAPAASNYFAIQGAAGGMWWLLLWAWPAARAWFVPGWAVERLVGAVAVPDVVLFVGGSLVAAWVCRRSERWAGIAAGVMAGVAGYAALLCLGLSVTSGEGWVGTILMGAAAATCFACVWLAGSGEGPRRLFRPAASASERVLAAQTTAQAAVFWALFLWVIPAALDYAARDAGVPSLERSAAFVVLGSIVFAIAGSLGVASAAEMVRRGKGTPLPVAAATDLVTTGPYGIVRNPMAVAGLLQGAGVALVLGSPIVLVYVALGGIVWDGVVRPLEEHDLRERFGAAFEAYVARVARWIPRRSAAAR